MKEEVQNSEPMIEVPEAFIANLLERLQFYVTGTRALEVECTQLRELVECHERNLLDVLARKNVSTNAWYTPKSGVTA